MVYGELRQMAAGLLQHESTRGTLNTTALVHEAYLRLGGARGLSVPSRRYFFGAAAQAMRRVLVDRAREAKARKRGAALVDLDINAIPAESLSGLTDLDDALQRLSRVDPRQAQVVELRFFGGLSSPEAAEVLGISEATVKRDWVMARAWLKGELASPNLKRI
jgi:RNA polymerase sigma factor (TIGR02999 family)